MAVASVGLLAAAAVAVMRRDLEARRPKHRYLARLLEGEAPNNRRHRPSRRSHASSEYGRPILKPPVWIWSIPAYFFVGGVAGAAMALALAAQLFGGQQAARLRRALPLDRRDRRRDRHRAADPRPRAQGAIPVHAPRLPPHLADERRLLGAGRRHAALGRLGAADCGARPLV